MQDGFSGGSSHGGAVGHGTGHGGAFGHANNAFGHPYDLGHVASTLGIAAAHGGHAVGHASVGHVGHAPGAVHAQMAWSYGYVGHALSTLGVLDPATIKNLTKHSDLRGVRLPGILITPVGVQVLVWPHGKADTAEVYRRIAARHSMKNLSRRAPGFVSTSKTEDTLISTSQFDGVTEQMKPSGFYSGATGKTTTFNEFWQLPQKKNFWSSPDIVVGPPMPPHHITNGATWAFDQTGDYETRLFIAVANPLTCVAKDWVPMDQKAAQAHFDMAVAIARDFYLEMLTYKPQAYSVTLRKMQAQAVVFSTPVIQTAVCVEAEPEETNGFVAPRLLNCGPGPRVRPLGRSGGSTDIISEMSGR